MLEMVLGSIYVFSHGHLAGNAIEADSLQDWEVRDSETGGGLFPTIYVL